MKKYLIILGLFLSSFTAWTAPENWKELNEKLITTIYSNQTNKLQEVKNLLKQGADPNAQDGSGRSTLMWAARIRNFDILDILLANPYIKVNLPDFNGQTPIMVPGYGGITDFSDDQERVEVAKRLIAHRANYNAKTNDGNTALMIAAEYGFVAEVKYLLSLDDIEFGPLSINARDDSGKTALGYAKENRHEQKSCSAVVDILVAAGARE